MPTFRVERTGNYTVMSNHHLRNENLSLKAKGLTVLYNAPTTISSYYSALVNHDMNGSSL